MNILVSSKTKKGLTSSALSFAGRAVPCGVRGQIRKRRRTKETDYPAIFLLAITKLTCWSLRFSQRCCWGARSSGMYVCVVGWEGPRCFQCTEVLFLRCSRSPRTAVVFGLLGREDEALRSFETSGTTLPTTQSHVPGHLTPLTRRHFTTTSKYSSLFMRSLQGTDQMNI